MWRDFVPAWLGPFVVGLGIGIASGALGAGCILSHG